MYYNRRQTKRTKIREDDDITEDSKNADVKTLEGESFIRPKNRSTDNFCTSSRKTSSESTKVCSKKTTAQIVVEDSE